MTEVEDFKLMQINQRCREPPSNLRDHPVAMDQWGARCGTYCCHSGVGAQLVEGSVRQLSDIVCNQRPLTLMPSCSVSDACRQMRDRRVGAVLVTNEAGRLLGIFTGRDAVTRIVAAGKSPTKTKLSDVMTPNPVTMSQRMTAIDALRLMWDGGFRHIPLMEDHSVVGIVSRGDFKANEEDRFEEERSLWEHMR